MDKPQHTVAELKKIRDTLKAVADRKKFYKLDFYVPYLKQKDFHNLGAIKRERLLMAANQVGKTYCGAAEAAFHLTGLYPAWWEGRKFNRPTKGWICGESSLLVRDGPQRLLCGTPGVGDDFGTGLIPKSCFADRPSMARGVTDSYDTIQVTHHTDGVADGISTATFKSYEQGRQKFQSATLDWAWPDEEPPEDVYDELLTRLIAVEDSILFMTFTPLKGRSKVVVRYQDSYSPDRVIVGMTFDDAAHYTDEKKRKALAGFAEHEREARSKGVPLLGSGAIFSAPEDSVKEMRLESVPQYWRKIWGIDFGINHPFAAALLLWDVDADVIHVHHTVRMSNALPLMHAQAMKGIGADVPVAWPQDGTARESNGIALSAQYRSAGLKMTHDHATWPEGGYSTEAGIFEMQEREASGRLRYAAHLSDLLEERRHYHRKDGMIVKFQDDILSAIRIGVMMKRCARPVVLGSKCTPRHGGTIAKGIDFDFF
jgi:phage terminase large subunit-like protein